MNEIERLAGGVAPLVAIGGILLAAALDPAFSWTGDALSALGVRPASAWAFNGGVMVGGALALVYTVGLFRTATAAVHRAIAGCFGLAALSLMGVGAFVAGHPLHWPAALGFYGLFTLAFLLDGLARRGSRTGRITLALVALHVTIWVSWLAGVWPGEGVALPEFAGALLVPVWIWDVGPAPVASTRNAWSGGPAQ